MTATITVEESKSKLTDNLEIYTKCWKPTSTLPVAQLLLLHGFSDHVNAYYAFPNTVASHGIIVFAFDQRGWGRTSPNKADWGATGPTSKLMADIDEVILMRLTAHPDLPLFLVGHSMGGGVVLTYGYAGTHRARLAGFVVWSPMINFAPESRPWSLVTAVGKLAARLAPGKKLVNKLPPSFMSRDGDVCREFSNDPLCHNTGTLECINEMLERGKTLDSGEVSNKFGKLVPLLVAHGSGDKVTDCAASKKFVENVQVSDKTFLQYDGWFHKLHAEPGDDRIKFANEMAQWMLERSRWPRSAESKL